MQDLPVWIGALGTAYLATQSGVPMPFKKAAAESAAIPAAPTVVVNGITSEQFMTGIMILAVAIAMLALAMLATGLLVRNGLLALMP